MIHLTLLAITTHSNSAETEFLRTTAVGPDFRAKDRGVNKIILLKVAVTTRSIRSIKLRFREARLMAIALSLNMIAILTRHSRTLLLCGARDQPAELFLRAEFANAAGQDNILPNIQSALDRAREIGANFNGMGPEIAQEMMGMKI
jgi:hypothetical protein